MFAIAIKAALLLGASWIGAMLLSRSTAAARHLIWTLGVVGALVLPLVTWIAPALPSSTAVAKASFELPAILVTPAAPSAPHWPLLAIAWVAGSLVVGVRIVRGHLAARRLVRTAIPSDGVLRSEAIGSPMTIGILRPRILVPMTWSPDRLHAVLAHERGHIARRDLLVQLLAQLACALYWWNPLVWLAAVRLRVEREHACDDLVLAAGILPSSYATDLLDVARSVSYPGAVCMNDTSTETRIRRVLDPHTPRRSLRPRFRIAACAMTLASVAILGCSSARSAGVAPVPQVSIGAPFVREQPLRPPTMFRAPTTKPAIDLALVAAEVQRRVGTLEQCYQRRLATKPSLAGKVVIHWVIEETGRVADACITEDTIGDHALTDCVNDLVRDQGPFPAPSTAADVSIPFVFAARS